MGGQAFHQGIRPGTLGHGNPAQYDYATIAGYLEQARPDGLGGVAEAYAMVQKALGETEGNLGKHVQRLNMIWKGGAKELGIADIRVLTEATGTLATASGQFSTAMHSGYTAMKISQHSMPPTSTPLGTLPTANPAEAMAAKMADDKAAQQHLAKTNTALASAFDQIPSSVNLDLPKAIQDEGRFGGGGAGAPNGSQRELPPAGANGGVPTEGAPGQSAGGRTNAPMPRTSLPGGLNSTYPHAGHLAPQTDGNGSGHSVLAGAQPESGQVPSGHPGNPQPVDLATGSGKPPSSAELPFGPTAPVLPHQPGGGYRPGRPEEAFPGRGNAGVDFPQATVPGKRDMLPGQVPPEALRAGGVLGKNGFSGRGLTDGSGGGFGGEAGGARLPAGGVLKNEALGPGLVDEPVGPFPRQGAGTSATGVPLGNTGGGAGGHGEQSREVQFVKGSDPWRDETEVAPRVIGGAE